MGGSGTSAYRVVNHMSSVAFIHVFIQQTVTVLPADANSGKADWNYYGSDATSAKVNPAGRSASLPRWSTEQGASLQHPRNTEEVSCRGQCPTVTRLRQDRSAMPPPWVCEMPVTWGTGHCFLSSVHHTETRDMPNRHLQEDEAPGAQGMRKDAPGSLACLLRPVSHAFRGGYQPLAALQDAVGRMATARANKEQGVGPLAQLLPGGCFEWQVTPDRPPL